MMQHTPRWTSSSAHLSVWGSSKCREGEAFKEYPTGQSQGVGEVLRNSEPIGVLTFLRVQGGVLWPPASFSFCLVPSEQVLHLWLEVLCSSLPTVEKWYQPWSFLRSPGWVQIKCELRWVSGQL